MLAGYVSLVAASLPATVALRLATPVEAIVAVSTAVLAGGTIRLPAARYVLLSLSQMRIFARPSEPTYAGDRPRKPINISAALITMRLQPLSSLQGNTEPLHRG
jgi:hypothetical protein